MSMRKPAPPRKPETPEARYAITDALAPVVAEADGAGVRRTISATEAARGFSDLIARVAYRGERYIIERGGKAMCELSPIGAERFSGHEFLVLLTTLPRPDAEFLDIVEALTRHQAPAGGSPWES